MTWAVSEAIARGISKDSFKNFSIDVLASLYVYYLMFDGFYDIKKILKWGSDIKKIYIDSNYIPSQDEINDIVEIKKIQFMYCKNSKHDINFFDFVDKIE